MSGTELPQPLVAEARPDLVRELALLTGVLCVVGGGLFLVGVTVLVLGIPLSLTAMFLGSSVFSLSTFAAAAVVAVFGGIAYLIGRAERRDFERQRTLVITVDADGIVVADRDTRIELGWAEVRACYAVRVGILRRRELWIETDAFDPSRDQKPGPLGRWRGRAAAPLGRTVVPVDRLSVPDYDLVLAIRECTDRRYPGPEREHRTMWLAWNTKPAT